MSRVYVYTVPVRPFYRTFFYLGWSAGLPKLFVARQCSHDKRSTGRRAGRACYLQCAQLFAQDLTSCGLRDSLDELDEFL